MAFAAYLDAVQKIYIAFYQRPADPAGLRYWAQRMDAAGGDQAAVIDAFATSPEAVALYGPIDASTIGTVVDAIYLALYNRAPDADGKKFYVDGFNAGTFTPGTIALNILNGASNDDAVAIANKLVVANQFTQQVDGRALTNPDFGIGSSFNVTYAGDADAVAARDILKAVTSSPATVLNAGQVTEVLKQKIADPTDPIQGESGGKIFPLTIGVDNIVGTSGNDTINGNYDAVNALHQFSGLDVIDGGAGTDTLALTDSLAAGGQIDLRVATVKNVEVLSVRAVANIVGNTGANTVDLTTFASGLTSATIDVAQSAALTVTAATTTTLNVTNNDDVTIVGAGGALVIDTDGDVVVGNSGAATKADINALTSVSVTQVLASNKKADITDNSGAAGAIGSKLTSVTLDGVGASSVLTGDGITTLSLANSNIDVTVTNTKAHTLGLTVNTLAANAEVIDDTATAVNITTTGTTADGENSVVIIDAGKAATITVTGAGDVELAAAGADYAALTTFNYTGSGSVTADLIAAAKLTKVVAGTATGAVDVTVDGAITSVTTGGGDDTVTIDGATTANFKGTLSLGDGSDTVAVANGGVITAGATVDAGDGVDNLMLAIVGVANVGAFKNFENFDVATLATDFDQEVLDANNDVQNFIGTAAAGGNITLDNLGAGVGFIVKGDMGAGANAVVLTQATAGALTITSDVDSDEGAGVVATNGELFEASNATSINAVFDNDNVDDVASTAQLDIEGTKATKLAVVSGGSNVTNTLNFTGANNGTNDLLTSVTITGDQALVFDYVSGGKVLKLASVDAAGQTAGGLTFDFDDLTTNGTLKLGAGDDILTVSTAIDTSAATPATVATINGFEKGSAEGLVAQNGFDVLLFAGAVQAANITGAAATAAGFSVTDGKVTWLGAGPATLAAATALLDAALDDNETVVFAFGTGTNYIYNAGASASGGTGSDLTDDMLVKLTGVTGINGLDVEAGTNGIYLF